MIVFSCFSPHPPLLLPEVSSEKDRKKVKKTLEALAVLARRFKEADPDSIIISSPHSDWGFNVPLRLLTKGFKGKIRYYLTGFEAPELYFEEGKRFYQKIKQRKTALIASGDMSHCLKENGPYNFHPDGPKFDAKLIEYLKNKNIKNLLRLDEMYPDAGECGLRSFCFVLGIMEAAKIKWQPEILSYEGPFGVGYLVAGFKI